MSWLCGDAPAYTPYAGSSVAPVVPTSPSWLARLFGCGSAPAYQPYASGPPVESPNLIAAPATGAGSSAAPTGGAASVAPTGGATSPAGAGSSGLGVTSLSRETLLVVPDAAFALLVGDAAQVDIVRLTPTE